jgi:glycerophosphoryl diester phosphodiesterase
MSIVTTHRALLSAHRGAAGQLGLRDNSWEALEAAVALAVDYVEFDIHRTRDGRFVLHHVDHVRVGRRKLYLRHLPAATLQALVGHDLVFYEDALRLLRSHGKKAHIDLKFASPLPLYADPEGAYELEAARIALEIMVEPSDFILTSLVDRSVRVLATWAAIESPGTLVGLSLGLGEWRLGLVPQLVLRHSEVFPARRLRRCGATLVVAQHRLASVRLLRWASRHGIPVLVWTVDRPRRLQRFLHDRRVWMVTSNHPSRAPRPELMERVDYEAVA